MAVVGAATSVTRLYTVMQLTTQLSFPSAHIVKFDGLIGVYGSSAAHKNRNLTNTT